MKESLLTSGMLDDLLKQALRCNIDLSQNEDNQPKDETNDDRYEFVSDETSTKFEPGQGLFQSEDDALLFALDINELILAKAEEEFIQRRKEIDGSSAVFELQLQLRDNQDDDKNDDDDYDEDDEEDEALTVQQKEEIDKAFTEKDLTTQKDMFRRLFASFASTLVSGASSLASSGRNLMSSSPASSAPRTTDKTLKYTPVSLANPVGDGTISAPVTTTPPSSTETLEMELLDHDLNLLPIWRLLKIWLMEAKQSETDLKRIGAAISIYNKGKNKNLLENFLTGKNDHLQREKISANYGISIPDLKLKFGQVFVPSAEAIKAAAPPKNNVATKEIRLAAERAQAREKEAAKVKAKVNATATATGNEQLAKELGKRTSKQPDRYGS